MAQTDLQWFSAIATFVMALATLALAAVAVFQDRIHAWLRRPNLILGFRLAPPDCHKTKLRYTELNGVVHETDCYMLRLSIANSGRGKAENVEVIAENLERKLPDGSYEQVTTFMRMNLTWSHTGRVFRDAISPQTAKDCDVAHIVKPSQRHQFPGEDDPHFEHGKAILYFYTEVRPTNLSYLCPPGDYRLHITLAAANAPPVRQILTINVTGRWYDDENDMFKDGVRAALV
jgi:hypothetical protein